MEDSKTASGLEKEPDGNRSLLLPGPFRKYLPSDIYSKDHIGQLSILDICIALTVALSYMALMPTNVGPPTLTEQELLDVIEYKKLQKFYLSSVGALAIKIHSLLPLDVPVLRNVSKFGGSFTLAMLFLALRRTVVAQLIALITVLLIGATVPLQSEASSLSVETLFWPCLATVIYSWNTLRVSELFTTSWYLHLAILSLSLGIGSSIKYIGIVTWVWCMLITFIQLYTISTDIRLKISQISKYLATVAIAIGLIPSMIFTYSNLQQVKEFRIDSPEFSTYMSPNFKYYLRGSWEMPREVYYGSVVTIRHEESLGGYLHSHNYTYETGSNGQQVTLNSWESDPQNQWVIEHKTIDLINNTELIRVRSNDKIKLRHLVTGKLLRASAAKPPVSEQDYTNEVSCTGDINYKGDADEVWSISLVAEPGKAVLNPLTSVFSLSNQGHQCDLIGHDTRLPDWGFNEQEVLCLSPATESRTRFYFEHVNTTLDCEYGVYPNKESDYSIWMLLKEYLYKQYKYNYYEKNSKSEVFMSAENWPVFLTHQRVPDIIWLTSIFGILLFICTLTKSVLTWNPWLPQREEDVTIPRLMFRTFGIECVLGWALHFYVFTKSPHSNLCISLYIPSFIMGELTWAHIMNYLYQTRSVANLILILLPIALYYFL